MASSKPSDPAPATAGSDADLKALLGEEGAPRRWPGGRLLWIGGAALAVLLAAALILVPLLRPSETSAYLTEAVRRGDLSVTVSATGTLEPVNQVDVGSELSGTVVSVFVDDNDRVRKGQPLAALDVSRLQDQIAQGEAAVTEARAGLAQAEATRKETGLRRDRLRRLFQISSGGYPARADIDAADAAWERAVAGVSSARGALAQATAALNTNRTNLSKAVVRSPVDGVVLARKVEPGQTVAASLQAPVLFTLAEDMRRMELHVDIDEADVGQVKDGQAASFTVDAWPGRDYPASVRRVGLGSTTKEGVVTYTGVLIVDNADLTLRPGMTATAEIVANRRAGVLLVPEAALRFTPPQAEASDNRGLAGALTPRMPRLGAAQVKRTTDPLRQTLWLLRDGKPVAVEVRVGAGNGVLTEVEGAGLKPGDRVITGLADKSA